jgi:hypothetical protein
MQRARVIWKRLRLLFAVLALIRFSILIPAVLIVTLLASDQMTDALLSLADGRSSSLAGAFLGTTLMAALIVWYTARTMLRFRFESNPASDPAAYPLLKRHLPRLLAMLVPVALLVRVLTLLPAVGDKAAIWRIAYALFGVATLTGLYVSQRRRLARIRHLQFLAQQEHEEHRELHQLAALPRVTRRVLWTLVGANVAAILLALWAPLFLLGAPALLLLGLGLSAVTGSALVYAANHDHIPVLTMLLLWGAFWSFFNDNHAVRQTADDHSHGFLRRVIAKDPNTLQDPSLLSRQTLEDYFSGWWDELAGQEPGTGPIPVVVVAADGGGIRAAYWTAEVLATLQDTARQNQIIFSRHVFAISGVSGGSLGAATYAAIAAHRIQAGTSNQDQAWVNEASAVLGRDFLSPTLANALFLDLPQRLLPLPIFDDRAVALEKSWEASWSAVHGDDPKRFSNSFASLWAITPHAVPLLFLNGTIVETGERAIIDPLATQPSPTYAPFANAIRIGPLFGTQLPLSTAVLLSARFTYVSPAGTMGTRSGRKIQWHRIVDGGYFDNSGSITAQEIIRAIQGAYRFKSRSAATRPMRLIMLHISNAPQNPRPSLIDWTSISRGRVWLGESLSPVRALLNTRAARAGQASESLMASSPDQNVSFYEIELWQGRADLPLGWSLSREAQSEMDQELTACANYGDKCAGNVIPKIMAALKDDSSP